MTSWVKCRLLVLSVLSAAVFPLSAVSAQGTPAVQSAANPVQKLKVALIVSPKESDLWKAAAPLRAGIYAAYSQKKNEYDLVEFTLSDPTKVRDVLNSAADNGAVLAIGPLSRHAVEALSDLDYLPLPVVAINRPRDGSTPELLMSMDMSAEGEADQLAKIAVESTADKNPNGSFVILTTNDPYDERLARAMEAAVKAQGATAERRTVSQEQLSYLNQEMRGKAFRGVFFAMNAARASLLRPYLPRNLPLFGTSYTNPMHQNNAMLAKTQSSDLNGMMTLELPAEDNLPLSNYSQYSEEFAKMDRDQREMFTVGLDVWRVGEQWLTWRRTFEFGDGLSGRLSFAKDKSPRVSRELKKTVVSPSRVGDSLDEVADFTNEDGEGQP